MTILYYHKLHLVINLLVNPCVKHPAKCVQKKTNIHWSRIFTKRKKLNNVAVENCHRVKVFGIFLSFGGLQKYKVIL